MKQACLQQLGGVVVLEDLKSANQKLLSADVSNEEKIVILKSLRKKKPAKEILKSTGIGKTVHHMCRDRNHEISSLALEIYEYWKSHVLHILHRKPIEVESDAETQRGRNSARKLINLALENSMIAEEIEIHVFNKCKKIMNRTYNRVIRKIHFSLKGNEAQRQQVSEMNCDLNDFVNDMFHQTMKVYAMDGL